MVEGNGSTTIGIGLDSTIQRCIWFWNLYHFLFVLRERERELCMILSLLLHTVDGRNPAPPNLYETL